MSRTEENGEGRWIVSKRREEERRRRAGWKWVCLAGAGVCGLAVHAADYNQTVDFGAKAPGDVVTAVVTSPGRVLTGANVNPGGFVWNGGPATFVGTIPPSFAGVHIGRFTGTYQRNKGGGHKGGGGAPPILDWEMDTKANVAKVDLDVDSDNNNGTSAPDRSDAEEGLEDAAAGSGKFVMVNQNDDDRDGVPDYADLEDAREGQFVPLVLEVQPPGSDWNGVTVRFSYAGQAFPGAADFSGKDIGNGFRDYRTAKRGALRLWNVDAPGAARADGNFIVNNVEYGAAALGFGVGRQTRTFYIEGINPADRSEIKATVKMGGQEYSDKVRVSVTAPHLGVNGNNNLVNGDGLRVGVPDVEFRIDEDDDVIEDQRDGFQFWWSRDTGTNISASGLVDLMPFVVEVPPPLWDAGFKFYLEVDRRELYRAYPAVSPSDNRRQYLQEAPTAVDQIRQQGRALLLSSGFSRRIPISHAGVNEFVLKGNGKNTGVCTLSLRVEEKDTSNQVTGDSARLTFRNSSDYWSLWSTRGRLVPGYVYRTEDNRSVVIDRYPEAAVVQDKRDTVRTKYLVWVHGYNISTDEARIRCDEMWKRAWWLGFRGNFVGLTWEGKEGSFRQFDDNVENAFQTSPAMLSFLHTVRGWAGNKAENVDILAHSLGNLVCYDALRLNGIQGRPAVIRNMLSLEAALWSETFLPEAAVVYDQPGDDPITYSPDELKQHSWAFWFNGNGRSVLNALDGGAYNSYFARDPVVYYWMRYNDVDQRGTRARRWHYFRNRLIRNPKVYRAPVGQNNLPHIVPALLAPGHRKRRYDLYDLRLPVGVSTNPMATVINYDAALGGWIAPQNRLGTWAHSQHFEQPYPIVYRWFNQYLGDDDGNQMPTRIRIGEE